MRIELWLENWMYGVKIKEIILCLVLKTKPKNDLHIGVWANRHRQYLKDYHWIKYYNLLTSEELYPYLADIEEQAENMYQKLVKSFAEQEKVTEKMKAENSMAWIQKINNIRNRAAEIVNTELIFK